MTTSELRQKYLDFFASKGHAVIPSASLIPENDPTTLFNSSGMQPLIPHLLGEKHAEGDRLVNSQKSFRTQDILEVGDNRHTTFFEMLGNWSLGDYFKNEQISWIFEFVTRELGLDARRLYFSCFKGNEDIGVARDEVSANLIKTEFDRLGIDAKIVDNPDDGLQGGRIFYYGDEKNWWSRSGVPANMPIGEPGGPDAEMFWDFGENLRLHQQSEWKSLKCHVNCDCGRFAEICNNVFMEYVKTESGFGTLPQKNVDFGGGLERMAMAVQDTSDIFQIDVLRKIIQSVEEIADKKYGESEENNKAFRVITDHLRAATFLIADGAVPSNKDQGYFTRRLLRRAVRFANKLGIKENFCADVAKQIIRSYEGQYQNLAENEKTILRELGVEEDKFKKTLESGIKEFEKGVDPFVLFTTYGFPIEITMELAEEKGEKIDKKDFDLKMKKHQELSRAGAEQKFKGGLVDAGVETTRLHTATHLLHATLRKVLGEHVEQKGSNITADRLRFDFSHEGKMTDDQKKEVEDIINRAIQADYPVSFAEMTVEEAEKLGAIGLFGEKYGTMVKVYTVGDLDKPFSREICGGPHVKHTGELGMFKIIKEQASSAGVRRIKAILA